MRRLLCAVAITAVFTTGTAVADLNTDYDRVLVPVIPSLSPSGAYGSQWLVEVRVRNLGSAPVQVTANPLEGGGCTQFCSDLLAPGFTAIVPTSSPNGARGGFIYIAKGGADNVQFAARVRDTSRSAENWGTGIPIVRPDHAAKRKIVLVDVPVDVRFRSALRVYDVDDPADRIANVTIYDTNSTTPLVQTSVTLTPLILPGERNVALPDRPGSTTIDDLVTAYPQLATAKTLRIEIEPVTPGLRFWAFVATTNNDTQEITLALPDIR